MIEGSRADEGMGPTRRCVSCRREGTKNAFLRFVVAGTAVHFDARQKMPGRGIQVCAGRPCLEKAAKGAFKRGAKRSDFELPSGQSWIEEQVVSALERLYRETLSAGRQCGQLLLGAEAVSNAAKAGELASYVVATDASRGTYEKTEANARRKGLAVLGILDRAALSRAVGRDNTVTAGWRAGKLHDRFAVLELKIRALVDGLPSLSRSAGNSAESGSEDRVGDENPRSTDIER